MVEKRESGSEDRDRGNLIFQYSIQCHNIQEVTNICISNRNIFYTPMSSNSLMGNDKDNNTKKAVIVIRSAVTPLELGHGCPGCKS